MPPAEWQKGSHLQSLICTVRAAGDAHTCHHSHGTSLIDYALISHTRVPFATNFEVIADVPWKPHLGIRLTINRRPEQVYTYQLRKPKPLPTTVDEGTWTIDDDEWRDIHHACASEAISSLQNTIQKEDPALKHASSIGTLPKSYELAFKYAQWSRAAERRLSRSLAPLMTKLMPLVSRAGS